MAITTYAELKTAIADFLNRDDLTSVVPTFISLAEAQMDRDIRHWRQEKRVETTLDERYENLPNDFLEIQELSLTDGTRLELIAAAEMQDWRQANNTSGKPRYYRVTADQFEFYPTPDSNYTLSMQYYARTPALSDAAPSNWVLTYAPDLYLYGSLVHTAPYLSEDARLQVWAAFYQSALESVRLDGQRGKYSGPLKMGVPR
jgi:hypothetical protein